MVDRGARDCGDINYDLFCNCGNGIMTVQVRMDAIDDESRLVVVVVGEVEALHKLRRVA